VARRYVRGALILVVAVPLTAPAALAQRAASTAAARMAQGGPRDPFDRGVVTTDATTDAGAGSGAAVDAGPGTTASWSGVAGAATLPLTGSASTPLLGVAAVLLLAGGLALWTASSRPRHAGDRPRHAR
jgi:hypothetical protein